MSGNFTRPLSKMYSLYVVEYMKVRLDLTRVELLTGFHCLGRLIATVYRVTNALAYYNKDL
jgi:hypothetical protein